MPPAAPESMSLLIVAPEISAAEALSARLAADGLSIAGASACHMMVRDCVRLAPEAIVVEAEALDADLLEALRLVDDAAPRPVLLFGPGLAGEPLAHALDAGVQEFMPGPCEAATLRVLLPRARARFERDRRLRRELSGAVARLEERKWIDRAKGLLMTVRQLSEPDAFALLRAASMQANLRVGEVSRAVIEAAEAAEAVNRAGQLRMLSQRLVKALALLELGVERGAAQAQRQESIERAQAIIDQLSALPLDAERMAMCQATAGAWEALHAELFPDAGGPDRLLRADALAQCLLDEAERLTGALQQLSGRLSLQVVNLAGRQRMLSQRVAKQALLAACLPEESAAAAAAAALVSVEAFDAALIQLERSPLAGDDIRATLAVARGQWQRLLSGMRHPTAREGRVALARESEALLQSFERLTSLYEHSMQVLLG